MFSHQLTCGQLGLSPPVRIQALISIISFINNAVIECIHFWCLSCCLLKVRLTCSPAYHGRCLVLSYILQLHLPSSKEITLSNEFGKPSMHFSFPFQNGNVHFSLLDFICPKHCEQCVLLMFSCIILYPETPDGNLRSESIPQLCYRLALNFSFI